MPGLSNAVGFTTDTSYADTSAQHGVTSYCRIAAVDLHDNAGAPSTELNAIPVGVGEKKEEVPEEFSLSQNYPNPFNPATRIEYSIGKDTKIKLEVFDLLGRHVATLVDGQQHAGQHSVDFNASRLASGFYVYRLSSSELTVAKKMMLVK